MATEQLTTQDVLNVDPWLEKEAGAIVYRHDLFRKWKQTITEHEGGYDKFTKGYLKMGFNVQPDNSVIYREWAPNVKEAVLIGEFSQSISLLSVMRRVS